jgi:hypothetical protein
LPQVNFERVDRVEAELAGKPNPEGINFTDYHASAATLCDEPDE